MRWKLLDSKDTERTFTTEELRTLVQEKRIGLETVVVPDDWDEPTQVRDIPGFLHSLKSTPTDTSQRVRPDPWPAELQERIERKPPVTIRWWLFLIPACACAGAVFVRLSGQKWSSAFPAINAEKQTYRIFGLGELTKSEFQQTQICAWSIVVIASCLAILIGVRRKR